MNTTFYLNTTTTVKCILRLIIYHVIFKLYNLFSSTTVYSSLIHPWDLTFSPMKGTQFYVLWRRLFCFVLKEKFMYFPNLAEVYINPAWAFDLRMVHEFDILMWKGRVTKYVCNSRPTALGLILLYWVIVHILYTKCILQDMPYSLCFKAT
jgi:hypothetical protein